MKKIIWIIPLLALITFLVFPKPKKQIAQTEDYEYYLKPEHLARSKQQLEGELIFWQQKLADAPNNHVYQKKMANLLARSFKESGDINALHQSDSLLHSVNKRIPNQVGVLHSLASNAITQHEFKEAEQYLKAALVIGEKQFISTLLLTDVQLERGQSMAAQQNLKQIASELHFDYLIRAMKYEDAVDNLDGAIVYMEQAAAKAEKSGNAAILNWSYSNLADMYGHAGRIKKSYQTYLKALSYNPADLHSLKGIAWIAFSHDHNTIESKRILQELKQWHPIPDYDLLLAEIATYEQNPEEAKAYERAFVQQASKTAYGRMYQTYLAELDAQSAQASRIAQAEVEDRPHPVIYDLLAWTTFQQGHTAKAIELINKHVLEQTGEPIAAYHAGIIFKANGQSKAAKKYLKQAKEASFELGPVISQQVEQALKEL